MTATAVFRTQATCAVRVVLALRDMTMTRRSDGSGILHGIPANAGRGAGNLHAMIALDAGSGAVLARA